MGPRTSTGERRQGTRIMGIMGRGEKKGKGRVRPGGRGRGRARAADEVCDTIRGSCYAEGHVAGIG